MKKINIIVVSVLLVVFGIVAVYAVGTNPGSRQDPVVTKSYVDNQINYIKNLNAGATTYQVVQVAKGKMLIGAAGTEVGLGSGEGGFFFGAGG